MGRCGNRLAGRVERPAPSAGGRRKHTLAVAALSGRMTRPDSKVAAADPSLNPNVGLLYCLVSNPAMSFGVAPWRPKMLRIFASETSSCTFAACRPMRNAASARRRGVLLVPACC